MNTETFFKHLEEMFLRGGWSASFGETPHRGCVHLSRHGSEQIFSPLTAVYFHLTGKEIHRGSFWVCELTEEFGMPWWEVLALSYAWADSGANGGRVINLRRRLLVILKLDEWRGRVTKPTGSNPAASLFGNLSTHLFRPIRQRFHEMFLPYHLASFEVGDGACEFEDAMFELGKLIKDRSPTIGLKFPVIMSFCIDCVCFSTIRNMANLSKNTRKTVVMTPEKREETMSLITFAMRSAKQFTEKLYKTDDFYQQCINTTELETEEAKKLFLYGCGREVSKATISLLGNEEHLEEIPTQSDTTTRLATESIIDGQNVVARKMIELMVNLINFSKTNEDLAYRIYLNSEKLDGVLSQRDDAKEFYDIESLNTARLIREFSQRVESDMKTLNTPEIWFLNKRKFVDRTPSVFSSVRNRYKRALLLAVPTEVVVLGSTYYTFFSRTSLSVHPTIGAKTEDFYEWETIEKNIGLISLLCINIIGRATELIGFDDDPHGANKMFRTASAAKTLMDKMNRIIGIGDFALAHDELAEVIETKTSKYGYVSYKVQFLHKSPFPEIREDWLKAHGVISIFSRASVREFLSTSGVVPEDVLSEMLKDTDDILVERVKTSLIDLAKRNLLIPLLWQSGMIKPTKHNKIKFKH